MQRGGGVDQISVAAGQKGVVAQKWTEFERSQIRTKVGAAARK